MVLVSEKKYPGPSEVRDVSLISVKIPVRSRSVSENSFFGVRYILSLDKCFSKVNQHQIYQFLF